MVKNKNRQALMGKFFYSFLFVVIIPLLLIYWASNLDRSISWSVPDWPFISIGIILSGGLIMLKGMIDLITFGQGLPMNAYPPKKFVTQGIYSWFSYPIYLGTALLSFGVALWFRSSSGLYVVTPILILAMASLVYGYEKLAMQKLFGNPMKGYQPIFSLPVASDKKVTWVKKIAMLIRIFSPWLIFGYLIDYIRCSQSCTGVFINLLNTQQWLVVLYVLWVIPYIYVALKLLTTSRGEDLRPTTIAGSLATLLGIYFYILLPAFGFDISNANWKLTLTNLAVFLFAVNYRFIWKQLKNFSEWIANSRHDWLFANGNFRIINHSVYSGFGGAIGVGIASHIIGNNLAVLVVTFCVIAGGAVFAQLWWGSNALLRPFGYWGAVLGGIFGVVLVYFFFGVSLFNVALAGVLCAPFAQAIGRLRCLAQGCCHGVVTNEKIGIRVWQSQSRIVTLSGLKGKYILVTQLYSILFNLLLGLLLWGMWFTHNISSSIIIGMYLVLTGIERFTEDAYRGEKQTKSVKGLRENQWIAIISVIVGIFVTMLPLPLPGSPIGAFNLSFFATAVAGGLLAAFAMSMDFPKSTIRFSRLSG